MGEKERDPVMVKGTSAGEPVQKQVRFNVKGDDYLCTESAEEDRQNATKSSPQPSYVRAPPKAMMPPRKKKSVGESQKFRRRSQ